MRLSLDYLFCDYTEMLLHAASDENTCGATLDTNDAPGAHYASVRRKVSTSELPHNLLNHQGEALHEYF